MSSAGCIQNWGSIKPKTVCIVILKNEQQTSYSSQVTLQKDGLLLESLNTQYEPYTVPVSEVLELWEFQRFMSNTIPDIELNLESIAKALREIQGDISILKEKR